MTPLIPLTMYAEIVVNRAIVQRQKGPSFALLEHEEIRQKTFTYEIPETLQGRLSVGHIVAVPLRHEELQGTVVGLTEKTSIEQHRLRPITELLFSEPLLTETQLSLARWLSREYLASLSICVSYFLPPGTNRQPLTLISLAPNASLPTDLSEPEKALFHTLNHAPQPIALKNVNAKVAKALMQRNLIHQQHVLGPPRTGPRLDRTLELLIHPDEIDDAVLGLRKEKRQTQILRYLAEEDDPLPTMERVLQATETRSKQTLRNMADKGWVTLWPKQTLINLNNQQDLSKDLSPAEAQVITQLKQAKLPLSLEQLGQPGKVLKPLIKANILVERIEPAKVALKLPRENLTKTLIDIQGVARQASVLRLLALEDGPIWQGWVYAQTEATANTLTELAKANLIAFDTARHWRDPLAEQIFTLDQPPPLSQEQDQVWTTIRSTLQSNQASKPFLLHGVTGSGKTEIYLQAIAEVLKQGQQIIFLVPEIILATQIVQRVQARFPQRVAIWHSALSLGERFDTWERVNQGDLPIIVGPRSALFAPTQTLGLIIIDEEHDPAYKQERMPTFHARDAAIELARLQQIPVILGSATPDLVSYRKAQRGEYTLLSLSKRILAHKNHMTVQESLARKTRRTQDPAGSRYEGQAEIHSPSPPPTLSPSLMVLPMPPVEVVDLREELKAGNYTIFSRALSQAITDTLAAGEQVILFLNRRGAATFVNCRDCGHVMQCPRCDTTLTYHSSNANLVCHFCGFHTRTPKTCPTCRSKRIRYFGLGTEKVEIAVKETFPQARVIRFDRDMTSKAGSHYHLLQQFQEGEANIMIGTQMVAKGLDLPLVTLVGVISADTGLYLPDMRAAERSFQLLMQMAGRAGRSPLRGRVIIQTYTPEQPAIIAASDHDYHSFYHNELQFRYEQGYPPFKRLACLQYNDSGYDRSKHEADQMAANLRLWIDQQGFAGVEVIGPAPAYVQRIRSRYRWQIILRAPNPAEILGLVPLPKGWKVDIDPVSLMG